MFGFRAKRQQGGEQQAQARQTPQEQPQKRKHPITEYAGGDRTAQRLKAMGLRDGGVVRGPGTGTSDDIEAVVPSGSYIMPADSTKAIGAQTLSRLGAPVSVNLSNGEYHLPPEQVHAIGVQVLDQMKAATHTPAKGFAPKHFFSEGGVVDDDRRRIFYVTSDGVASRGTMPSSSRAMVPVGPSPSQSTARTSTSRPDFYTNSRGETARGFPPSASRDVVPVGPVVNHTPEKIDPSVLERNRERIARDSAAYQAERAAQDARFAEAQRQQTGVPRQSVASRVRSGINKPGPTGAVLFAVPALASAAEEDSTARYARRFGISEPTGDGSLADIAKFAALRGLGFASDLASSMTLGLADALYQDKNFGAEDAGGVAGGAAGAVAGNRAGKAIGKTADTAARVLSRGRYKGDVAERALTGGGTVAGGVGGFLAGRDITEQLSRDPAASRGHPEATVPSSSDAAAASPARDDRAPNEYRSTGVSGIVGRLGPDGVYEFTNDPAAVAGASRDQIPLAGRGGFTVVPSGAITAPDGEARERVSQALQAAADRGDWDAVQRYYAAVGQQSGGASTGPFGFKPSEPIVIVGQDTIGDDLRRKTQEHLAMQPARGPDGREFMTASQRQMLRDDQRAQTDLSLAALQQAGEDRRAMLREAGESARFAARNALDERRLAGEQTALDFQNRAAERIERLYQQYEAASSPEERAAIAEQLRVLTGGQQANRFTVVPGGQEIDPITQQLVTRPAMVFNNQTGQFVPQPRSLPPIAENPAVIAIMNDTSLSREERAKRIRALGYQ